MKLSSPQVYFLHYAKDPKGYETPFIGGKKAGRVASAWYRTAQSLQRLGLIRLEKLGDHEIAYITTEGKARLALGE